LNRLVMKTWCLPVSGSREPGTNDQPDLMSRGPSAQVRFLRTQQVCFRFQKKGPKVVSGRLSELKVCVCIEIRTKTSIYLRSELPRVKRSRYLIVLLQAKFSRVDSDMQKLGQYRVQVNTHQLQGNRQCQID
jgi:hypothetical protein